MVTSSAFGGPLDGAFNDSKIEKSAKGVFTGALFLEDVAITVAEHTKVIFKGMNDELAAVGKTTKKRVMPLHVKIAIKQVLTHPERFPRLRRWLDASTTTDLNGYSSA